MGSAENGIAFCVYLCINIDTIADETGEEGTAFRTFGFLVGDKEGGRKGYKGVNS